MQFILCFHTNNITIDKSFVLDKQILMGIEKSEKSVGIGIFSFVLIFFKETSTAVPLGKQYVIISIFYQRFNKLKSICELHKFE